MPFPSSMTRISLRPALLERHVDPARSGIDGVLDKLLHRRRRPLDHFACRRCGRSGSDRGGAHAGLTGPSFHFSHPVRAIDVKFVHTRLAIMVEPNCALRAPALRESRRAARDSAFQSAPARSRSPRAARPARLSATSSRPISPRLRPTDLRGKPLARHRFAQRLSLLSPSRALQYPMPHRVRAGVRTARPESGKRNDHQRGADIRAAHLEIPLPPHLGKIVVSGSPVRNGSRSSPGRPGIAPFSKSRKTCLRHRGNDRPA